MTNATVLDPGATASRPRLVRVAVWSYVAIAIVNVGVGAWTLAFVPSIVRTLERQGRQVPAEAVVFTFVTIGLTTLLFSGALAFFALRLRRGSTWARPALLTVSILSLAALISGGGPGLIVILLCVVAAIIVTRAPVSAWLRSMRGLPPG